MIAPGAGGLQDGSESEPQCDRAERKAVENAKHRAVTDLLRHPSANRRTERRADARHNTRHCNALQSGANPVKSLNRINAPSADQLTRGIRFRDLTGLAPDCRALQCRVLWRASARRSVRRLADGWRRRSVTARCFAFSTA